MPALDATAALYAIATARAGGDHALADEIQRMLGGDGDAPPTAEVLAARAVARYLAEHGPPPFPGAVFDASDHHWHKSAPAAAERPRANRPDLPESDRHEIDAGIDRDVAALPDGQRPDAATVARAKDIALTVVARTYLFLNRIAVTRTFALVGEALSAALDTPADMAKLGYNPTASSGTAGPQVLDPVKDATGISGHLVASIAAKVITRAVFYAKQKVAAASTGEADEAAAAVDMWAEFIAHLLAHLDEQLDAGGGAPDAASVAEHIRHLLGRAQESRDASGHEHGRDGRFAAAGGGRTAGPAALWSAFESASDPVVKDYLAAALHNGGVDEPESRKRLPKAVDPHRMAEAVAQAYAQALRAGHPHAAGALAGVMPALGLALRHAAGDEVPFDGRYHQSEAPAFTGDRVRVGRPGVVGASREGHELVHVKAHVSPV